MECTSHERGGDNGGSGRCYQSKHEKVVKVKLYIKMSQTWPWQLCEPSRVIVFFFLSRGILCHHLSFHLLLLLFFPFFAFSRTANWMQSIFSFSFWFLLLKYKCNPKRVRDRKREYNRKFIELFFFVAIDKSQKHWHHNYKFWLVAEECIWSVAKRSLWQS